MSRTNLSENADLDETEDEQFQSLPPSSLLLQPLSPSSQSSLLLQPPLSFSSPSSSSSLRLSPSTFNPVSLNRLPSSSSLLFPPPLSLPSSSPSPPRLSTLPQEGKEKKKSQNLLTPPSQARIVGSNRNVGAESDEYFPYPYSGTHFVYHVPVGEARAQKLNDGASWLRAESYATNALRQLPILFPKLTSNGGNNRDRLSAFVYPSADPEHAEFLSWVKLVQFLLHTPMAFRQFAASSPANASAVQKSALAHFHAGNPHMQQRWLSSLDEQSNRPSTDAPDGLKEYFEPLTTDDQQHNFYVKNAHWIPENFIPLNNRGDTFLVLQSLSPSAITTARAAQIDLNRGSSDYVYCGDLQLSWELALQQRQEGDFTTCKNQLQRQRRLASRFSLPPTSSAPASAENKRGGNGNGSSISRSKETLEDLVELMTSEPLAITTLRREADSLAWMIGARRGEIADIQRKARQQLEAKLSPGERKSVDADLDQLRAQIEGTNKQIGELSRKRLRIVNDIAEYHRENDTREKVGRYGPALDTSSTGVCTSSSSSSSSTFNLSDASSLTSLPTLPTLPRPPSSSSSSLSLPTLPFVPLDVSSLSGTLNATTLSLPDYYTLPSVSLSSIASAQT